MTKRIYAFFLTKNPNKHTIYVLFFYLIPTYILISPSGNGLRIRHSPSSNLDIDGVFVQTLIQLYGTPNEETPATPERSKSTLVYGAAICASES